MTTTMTDLQTGRSYVFNEALPGRDAYEEALAAGFVGDRDAWLAALRGFMFNPASADWEIDRTYRAQEAVRHANKLWVAATPDTGTEPGTDAAVWVLLLDGPDPADVASVADDAAVIRAAADQIAADLQTSTTLLGDVETKRGEVATMRDLTYGYTQDAASAVVYQNLASLAASKAETAVDVLVYDTTRDSDGGAWRGRCQSKSWYTETLNTAIRGSRRAFPAVAVIVATASAVTIYDGDDPALPMWRVQTPGQTITSLAALNGRIALGTTTGVVVLDYAADAIGGALTYTTATSPAIVNNSVLDLDMAVLAGAPTAPATGLPVPTIAVATSGGASLIKADGSVVNSATTAVVWKLAFAGENLAWSPNSTPENWEITENIGSAASGFTPTEYLRREDTATGYYPRGPQAAGAGTRHVYLGGNRFAMSNTAAPSAGVFLYHRGVRIDAVKNKGQMAKITTTYNTGWMPGDIKGAWLASRNTASLVGGTDTDRTHNAANLSVTGTITRTPVATGADLVGYGGFSAANFLSATNAAFADTLYALGWVQTGGVWEFKHGVVSAAPIDGLTITGTTLKIEGTKPKALIRLTATVPTADQIAAIHADEGQLFKANAACTLYGASDAVTALAHDPATGLLHVGTSAGRSVFSGLRRIANTTTPVTTALAAVGDLIAEQ